MTGRSKANGSDSKPAGRRSGSAADAAQQRIDPKPRRFQPWVRTSHSDSQQRRFRR